MKTLVTLFLAGISSVMLAQIPNNSFENWTSGNLNGWGTTNSDYAGGVTQSSTAQSGTYSVQLNNVLVGGTFNFGGQMASVSLSGDSYFVNAGNPAALNGWYQLTVSGGDELTITTGTKCGKKVSGAALINYTTTTTANVWKQFSACLVYDTTCTADSAEIVIGLENSGGQTHTGSTALIDDLSFGTCTPAGVSEISNNNVSIEAAYPNPANTTCNIIFSLSGSSMVNVALYDLSGRKVLTALDNTVLSDGRYKVPVDVTKLANGIYTYTVIVDGVPYTQKLVVTK